MRMTCELSHAAREHVRAEDDDEEADGAAEPALRDAPQNLDAEERAGDDAGDRDDDLRLRGPHPLPLRGEVDRHARAVDRQVTNVFAILHGIH